MPENFASLYEDPGLGDFLPPDRPILIAGPRPRDWQRLASAAPGAIFWAVAVLCALWGLP